MWNLDLFRKSVHACTLGSGSRGNAAVVWSGDDAVLVDCGLSAREIVARLERVGLAPERVRAILITHEHGDHVGGAEATAVRLGVPVYLTAAAGRIARIGPSVEVRTIAPGESLRIGRLEVEAFPIPHDTVDTLGFIVGSGPHRIGFATDMGSIRRSVVERLRTCRAALLEFNHDEHLLWSGAYPEFLKERVAGDRGHLSNRQGAELLTALAGGQLQHVVLGHLSEQNNDQGLALSAARAALASRGQADVSLWVAEQGRPSPPIHLTD